MRKRYKDIETAIHIQEETERVCVLNRERERVCVCVKWIKRESEYMCERKRDIHKMYF